MPRASALTGALSRLKRKNRCAPSCYSFRLPGLGIGDESRGCGGAMTPGYYVSQLKIFSRYVRNYNPWQTGEQAMRRVAVGPDGANTDYTEAVMKAWHDKVWSWDIEGRSLHAYTTGGWPIGNVESSPVQGLQ